MPSKTCPDCDLPRAVCRETGGCQPDKPTDDAARKGIVSRVHKGDLDRITAYLPVELGAQLRMACAGQRIELSEAIAAAVRAWLAENDPTRMERQRTARLQLLAELGMSDITQEELDAARAEREGR